MNATGRATGTESRYELILRIASGGMGTVYCARARGALGFSQLVAVKVPHSHLLEDAECRRMLLREARLSALIRHANVVSIRDVEAELDRVWLVMDYVEGCSLDALLGEGPLPAQIAIRIVLDACAGLHAAHEARDEKGRPLGIVHRDISPHNILVGIDGVARVTDFGIAKAVESNEMSRSTGGIKGKLAYMAPEYMMGQEFDRRADVFALAVILWEALSGTRLFATDVQALTITQVLTLIAPPIDGIDDGINTLIARGLAKKKEERISTAAEFASTLERAALAGPGVATSSDVIAFVREQIGPQLEARRVLIEEAASLSRIDIRPSAPALHGTATETLDEPFAPVVASHLPGSVTATVEAAPVTHRMPMTEDVHARLPSGSEPHVAPGALAAPEEATIASADAWRRDATTAPSATKRDPRRVAARTGLLVAAAVAGVVGIGVGAVRWSHPSSTATAATTDPVASTPGDRATPALPFDDVTDASAASLATVAPPAEVSSSSRVLPAHSTVATSAKRPVARPNAGGFDGGAPAASVPVGPPRNPYRHE